MYLTELSLARIVGWLENKLEVVTDENYEKSQVIYCPVRDSNRTPSEYSSDVLHLEATYSVKIDLNFKSIILGTLSASGKLRALPIDVHFISRKLTN